MDTITTQPKERVQLEQLTFQGENSRLVRWRRTLVALRQSPVGMVGAGIVIAVLILAVFGSQVSPHDPGKQNLRSRFQSPAWSCGETTFFLGTDHVGRDILSRIIAGSRVSTIVGVSAVVVAGTIGVIIGLVAGFLGGWVDTILMRITDAFLAIPFIVLVVAISGVVGPGLLTLVVILGFTNWATYTRVVRGEVLSIRERDYVTAAQVIGQRRTTILFKHILPNTMASVIVLATIQVAITILAESSLSFLGLGVQPPTVTWGLMLADGREYVGSAWWMATFPGLAITITVLGIVFLGDWLRDVLDPRLRGVM